MNSETVGGKMICTLRMQKQSKSWITEIDTFILKFMTAITAGVTTDIDRGSGNYDRLK